MAVSDYDPIIEAAAKEWDVDPNWARAVMHHESGGNPVDAQGRPIRSSAGAGGLMQIIPRTAADLGVQNVDNPVENIWGGVKYLAQLRGQFGGNVANATAAYNAGPDRVSAHLANGTPLPPETQAYLPSVAGNYQRFAARYPARPAAAASSPVAAAPKTPIAAPASPASGAMADDDFLKRAAGSRPQTSAGTGAVLPDDEFLKRAASGGNVSTAASPPVVPDAEDIQPRPGNAPEAMFNAAIRGAKEGWQNTPDILSPAASQWLSDHGLGVIGNNTGLPSYLLKGAAAAGNALTSAATTGITRAAEGIGDQSAVLGRIGNFPLLGRDLAAMAENPLAAAPHGMIPANGNPVRPSAFDAALNERVAQIHRGNPLATDTAPAALTGEMRSAINGPPGNPLAASPANPAIAAPAPTVPVFGRLRAPAPIENASGAAAAPSSLSTLPREGPDAPANPLSSGGAPAAPPAVETPTVGQPIPTGLTAAQIAEFKNIPESLPPQTKEIRTQADAAARADEILRHFASIGNTAPIPGIIGALPTVTGNSGLATLYRAVRDADTPVPFTTLEQAGKQRSADTVAGLVKTEPEFEDAVAARKQDTDALREAAWENKKAGDPSPAAAEIDRIMASPARFNPVVETELPKLRKMLMGEDGKSPVTDPEDMYGIDKAMRYKISSLAAGTKDDARAALPEITQVLKALRPQIEDAAPGFDKYMSTFSDQSRAIDEMKYLQGRKLVDAANPQNPITLQNVKATLDDIAKQQRSSRITLADSVSPETVATLQRVRDQMQREADTQSLGKALGSNTFQNAATSGTVGRLAGHISNPLISMGLGGVTGLLTGGGAEGAMGSVIGHGLGAGVKVIAENRAAKAEARAAAGRAMLMQELRDRLLNIDNKGVNTLNPPPP